MRHGGQNGQDVELRQVLAAVDADVRGGRAGRVAGPVRAARGGGARGPRAVLRRVRGRAAAASRVRRGRLPADPVQHVRPHVRRRRRADRGRLLHGDLRQAVLGDRPRRHGKQRPGRPFKWGQSEGVVCFRLWNANIHRGRGRTRDFPTAAWGRIGK